MTREGRKRGTTTAAGQEGDTGHARAARGQQDTGSQAWPEDSRRTPANGQHKDTEHGERKAQGHREDKRSSQAWLEDTIWTREGHMVHTWQEDSRRTPRRTQGARVRYEDSRSRRTTIGQLKDKKRTTGGQHPNTGFRVAVRDCGRPFFPQETTPTENCLGKNARETGFQQKPDFQLFEEAGNNHCHVRNGTHEIVIHETLAT